MDDTCAVCAEELEWVAYGPCCHREVCSTCIVRLRFILDDRRCCICKSECPTVFITKALGDYTRVITDFTAFSADAKEGKTGAYWYDEDAQAYFDDVDHYRMMKAMCRLSCSLCDKSAEEQGGESLKRRPKFRSIEQLKGHLFHQHKVLMCKLCLQGRKVFICEQKLYTRSQLDHHIAEGDPDVDGSESERGGFKGHPMCEYCDTPFYGENELYTHMSTKHETCHLCRRENPSNCDYYRDYNDLEKHFRSKHYLCENEACLEKKFVVFPSEAALKKHNVVEHGGNMSRARRNAALQIPVSFSFRPINDRDQRRGRGRGFRHGPSDANDANYETEMGDGRGRGSFSSQNDAVAGYSGSLTDSSTAEPPSSSSRDGLIIEESSFPPLSDHEPPEPSSRYVQALQSSMTGARLREESFPPLPGSENSNKPMAAQQSEPSKKGTLAARLQQRSKGSSGAVRRSAWSKPSANHEVGSSSSTSTPIKLSTGHGISSSTPTNAEHWPAANQGTSSSSSAFSQVKPAKQNGLSSQPWLATNQGASSSSPPVSQVIPAKQNGLTPVSTNSKMKHSSSAPNLSEESNPSHETLPTSSQSNNIVEYVRTNKSLVERIRASLGMEEDRFSAFKTISSEYRQGLINTWEYLSYVEQFGLSHLVLELAELCPDPQKRKELIDAYNANMRTMAPQVNDDKDGKKGKGKGKGQRKAIKFVDDVSTTDASAERFLDSVRKLQSLKTQADEEVEVLSKDGYRVSKDKPKSTSAVSGSAESDGRRQSMVNSTSSDQSLGGGGGSKQQQHKGSKSQKIRLGDGSISAFFDQRSSIGSFENTESQSSSNPSDGLPPPVRGVWRNGGGMKLVANTQKK